MSINEKQKMVLYIVIGIIVLMLLFPPTHFSAGNDGAFINANCGYQFILSDNCNDSYCGCRIDISILVTQWIGTLIVGGIGFLLVKDQKG